MRRSVLIVAAVVVLVVGVLPFLPIVLAEPFSACACLDERKAILNPFRDRAPERVGADFLAAADSGGCSSFQGFTPGADSTAICKEIESRPARGGSLINRRQNGNTVVLVFQNNQGALRYVGVVPVAGTWKVTGYAVIR